MRRAVVSIALLLSLGLAPAGAHSGDLRVSARVGPYRVAAFTGPSPPRAGPLTVSVLVQDAASGAPLPDARVRVVATPEGGGPPIAAQAAAHGIERDARLNLPAAGAWRVEVHVTGDHGPEQVGFPLAVADAAPRVGSLWPWIAWPLLPLLLYTLVQRAATRRLGRG